ncbi:MAG: flagellar M-ring protein FliF [Novosphingobium sp. 16-62-11]|uniref:flagellar basal-body MS-ring/collar protein FliF n=1 Tax=Novosphingobium sp. 17-62-19 TaxID=1970406 RepID=UPI000BD3202F|nr:flagellar basal-body MS-ring/collar protein FliF [Novosphingobium sp. 17-62-19]OYX96728.1 MAG: flagellar M-ring protein FliF [Novosphingobium sp. 35-62-5]OYZ44702.1 MAG: flagellar M-ring protein FliF [Novosphingobium sp. 16-62-11]OZA17011.1 MAG: flagellar M-ring protein FliF [Novosphingobium sp. 17-62-19]HQS97390.1 flagellar basal-body MS-ring/collar protein FliF [Novosphingobium sp.]
MADLVDTPSTMLGTLSDPAGGSPATRAKAFLSLPPVRRMLPWFAGVSAAGLSAVVWMAMSPAPQRMLYSQLSDGERAEVIASLEKAAIAYQIDSGTGAVTVGEDDLYKARMAAASDGAIATPETGMQMLDKLPMGASRGLEGQRLKAARERELELTIMEIDGVESVRVHLAEPEKSVFVRDNIAPTASVMAKLKSGRQLSDSQVRAIVNLVSGSIPGLSIDAVRVVDQHGRLLSEAGGVDGDRLELQQRMEEKLRQQITQLLTPMLGDGNFSSEIQVDLDMDQVTSARESYDKEGVVRQETQSASNSANAAPAQGVPGVTANTPPPATVAQPGAPAGTPPAAAAPVPQNTESTSAKTYELGREVAVSNQTPGKIKRLSVAVALSAEIMAKAKPAEIEQIKQLINAAVGADTARGDQVAVAVRAFKPAVVAEPAPFWETPWFATILRNGVALLSVLLVLLLGVRPLIKAFKREPAKADDDAKAKKKKRKKGEAAEDDDSEDGDEASEDPVETPPVTAQEVAAAIQPAQDPETGVVDAEALARQVSLAQRLVVEKPDNALVALKQMLKEPEEEGAA